MTGEAVLEQGRRGVQHQPALLVVNVDRAAAHEPAWPLALPGHVVRDSAVPCGGEIGMPCEAVLEQGRRGVQHQPALLVVNVDRAAAHEPAWPLALPGHVVRDSAVPCGGKIDVPCEAVLVQEEISVQEGLCRCRMLQDVRGAANELIP